jgi:hypothetical protein
MKRLFIILSIFTLVLSISSCNKNPLIKGDGTWDYILTDSWYKNGSHQSTDEEYGTITFEKDGSGNQKENGSATANTFTWSKSGNTVVISYTGGGSFNYTIIEDGKKSQKWTCTKSTTSGGIIYRDDYEFKLTR